MRFNHTKISDSVGVFTSTLFWFVVLGFVAWWGLSFGTYGLFDDGVFYGCISRNWAFSDNPNWWVLVVSPALDDRFNGHPPFAFWVQSLFFNLFGEAFWIEHLYGLLLAVLTAWGMIRLFERLYPSSIPPQAACLGVFLWLMMPIVGWSYQNNMLENTLSALTVWAVFWLTPKLPNPQSPASAPWSVSNAELLSHLTPNPKNFQSPAFFFTAALFIFFATLTKGPVGLFPLAAIGIHWLVFRQEKFLTVFFKTAGLVALLVGAYALLISLSANAKAFLLRYLDMQLVGSLSGQDRLTGRLVVLEKLFTEPLIALAVVVLAWLWVRKKQIALSRLETSPAYFFGILGAAASLPMMISPKQLPFYIVPALPYFALALAVLLLPIWEYAHPFLNQNRKLLRSLQIGILLGLCGMCWRWGTIGRNHEMLEDVFQITQIVPPNDTVGIQNEVYKQWNLHGYLYRFGRVNLSTAHQTFRYQLLLPNESPRIEPQNYQRIELPLNRYVLYKKI